MCSIYFIEFCVYFSDILFEFGKVYSSSGICSEQLSPASRQLLSFNGIFSMVFKAKIAGISVIRSPRGVLFSLRGCLAYYPANQRVLSQFDIMQETLMDQSQPQCVCLTQPAAVSFISKDAKCKKIAPIHYYEHQLHSNRALTLVQTCTACFVIYNMKPST